MKLIYLDIETTGLNCPDSGLIQLAGVIEMDGGPRDSFDFRIRPFPQDVVTDEALAVNGVTREELKQYDPPEKVFRQFLDLLGRYVDPYDRSDKFHLVAYNARFDVDHLRAWFEKNGDTYFGSWFWHPALDVMALAAAALMEKRSSMPDFRLSTVARTLRLEVDEAKTHGAMYDVELTRRVHLRLLKLLGGKRTPFEDNQ